MVTPEDQQLVQRALEIVSEHFDCVQLLASRQLDNFKGTERVFVGRGNWFGRKGMCHDFLEMDNQIETAKEIASKLKDTDQN